MQQPAERQHQCLPLTAQPCPHCGERLEPPVYCGTCGEDISPAHVCQPHPLPHVCANAVPVGRCLACGESLPESRYCTTCGAVITPSHRCSAAPPTHVHRADPVHVCPSMKLRRCPDCGELLPALVYCEHCGVDITPPHVCQPKAAPHICPPHLMMPRRCSHCGELMSSPQHCTRCGADITPVHQCGA